MAIQTINYNDKISVSTSVLPNENQVLASDMNNIKSVVNANSEYLPLRILDISITPADIVEDLAYTNLGMKYRSPLLSVSAINSEYFPDGQIAYNSNYVGAYLLSTVNGGLYVYFSNMPTQTVVIPYITLYKSGTIS